VEEFWWSATYVAKRLWRDELFFADASGTTTYGRKRCAPCWNGASSQKHEWALKPACLGSGSSVACRPRNLWRWCALSGPALEENGKSFPVRRSFAEWQEVGQGAGLSYPLEVDQQVRPIYRMCAAAAPAAPPRPDRPAAGSSGGGGGGGGGIVPAPCRASKTRAMNLGV